jgi:hypothetical protein
VPPAATPEVDSTAQLQNLAQLHAQGVLTAEEFAAAKAKILGIRREPQPGNSGRSRHPPYRPCTVLASSETRRRAPRSPARRCNSRSRRR